ncbi:MAG: DUF1826 domain-containing protein [Pseudomonadota bacterium]
MNFHKRSVPDRAIDVHIADTTAALSRFVHPGHAAAIWRRQMPPDVQSWLDRVHPDNLPRGRLALSLDDVWKATQDLFDLAELPVGPERDWLQRDIVELSHLFSNVLSARYLKMRLEVITTNACRKFHIDAVTARMVCTYRGSGTQYGVSIDGNDPRRVFTVQTGAPIMLRGSLWPVSKPPQLVHRSPPIDGTGETRLVLVLDQVADLEETE